MSSGSKSSGGGGFMMPPPQNLPSQFGGTGPMMPQRPQTLGRAATGNGLAAPDWATNWFAMPWWGQPAPNVGAALWQQMHPEQYRDMRRLQQKRGVPNRNRNKKKARRRQSSERPVYGPPPGGAPSQPGRGGFLGYGSFGGRQK